MTWPIWCAYSILPRSRGLGSIAREGLGESRTGTRQGAVFKRQTAVKSEKDATNFYLLSILNNNNSKS